MFKNKNVFKNLLITPLTIGFAFLPLSFQSGNVAKTIQTNTTVSDVNKKPSLLIYDGKLFDNMDQVVAYYLQQNSNDLTTKNVIGNVSEAVIDFDEGLLNQYKLYDYDLSKIKPVYLKSNNETTSSYLDAKRTYANPVLIRTRYQGVNNLFNTQEEAKAERDSLIQEMVLPYYENVPHPTNENYFLKLNPFNSKDTTSYQEMFEKALNKTDYKISNHYKKEFVIKEEIEGSFFKKNSVFSIEKDDDDKTSLIPYENILDTKIKNLFKDQINLGFDNKENGDSFLEVNEKLEVGIGKSNKNLSISFFNGLFDFKDKFDMYFDKPKENWKSWRDDSKEGVSKVVFDKAKYDEAFKHDPNKPNEELKENALKQHFHKQNNQTNLLDFLTNESNFNQHKITVFADGKKWDFSLSKSKQWTALIKEVKEQVQNIQNQVGNNFSMTLRVNINSDGLAFPDTEEKKLKEYHNFEGINWKLIDSWGNDNKFAIEKLDLSKFKFEVNFQLDGSIIKNVNNEIKKQINLMNQNNHQDFNKTLKQIIDDIQASGQIGDFDEHGNSNNIVINLDELDTNLFKKAKEELDDYEEFITFNNQKLFAFKRTKEVDNQFIELKNISKSTFNRKQFIESVVQKWKAQNSSNMLNESDNLKHLLNLITSNEKLKEEFSNLTTSLKWLKQTNSVLGLTSKTNDKNFLDLPTMFLSFLQSLKNHLKQIDINFDQVTKFKDFPLSVQKSFVMWNKVINFNDSTSNVIKTPLGKYLLINPGYFNSQIIEKNLTNSIGQNGVFNQNEQQAFDKHKEAVLSGKAPVVKVLYNLDGQEILGSLELGKPLLYDNDELVLAQASSLTNVNRDLDHVFYTEEQTGLEVKVANLINTIYVLKWNNNNLYFKNHSFAINFLKQKLREETTSVV